MPAKTILLTGGTSGIGQALAVRLLREGARVVVVGRESPRARSALAEISAQAPGTSLEFLPADLSLQTEVRLVAGEFLSKHDRLDVLVNNAGALFSHREVTAEGFERTWATNHLAPFLLTHLLLDRLRASAPSRIVITSSAAHRYSRLDFDDLQMERRYRGFTMYSRTKLANLLFTRALARRLSGSGVTANCFHPGVVRTGLFARPGSGGLFFALARPFMISPEKASVTPFFLCTDPGVSTTSGGYFAKSRIAPSSPLSQDLEVQGRLWKVSEQMTGTAG